MKGPIWDYVLSQEMTMNADFEIRLMLFSIQVKETLRF